MVKHYVLSELLDTRVVLGVKVLGTTPQFIEFKSYNTHTFLLELCSPECGLNITKLITCINFFLFCQRSHQNKEDYKHLYLARLTRNAGFFFESVSQKHFIKINPQRLDLLSISPTALDRVKRLLASWISGNDWRLENTKLVLLHEINGKNMFDEIFKCARMSVNIYFRLKLFC